MDSNERFPLLGFPHEEAFNDAGLIVYRCLVGDARIVVWLHNPIKEALHLLLKGQQYGVNIYRNYTPSETDTDRRARYNHDQSPIIVEDPFEVQLAIFFLIEKHLPKEVTIQCQ
ncbi:MAG: hypothetical protein ACJ8CB_17435 [Ktedonobacteraceae bacterium]